MLQPHDLVPHFEVTDLRGERIRYSSIWQRRNLVLVTLPGSGPPSRDYARRLPAPAAGPDDADTVWIATTDTVEGLPPPGLVIADRWGEVVHVAHPAQVQDLPAPDEIADWVQWLRHRCPECEGEAR
jgi:hypothetical protein